MDFNIKVDNKNLLDCIGDFEVTYFEKLNFDEVLVQDFDDDYHAEKDETMILLNQARNLLNQYHDVNRYNDAMEIYNEYMNYLYDKYGGYNVFKGLQMCGLIEDFVPTKPALKKTERVKKLLNYGIFNANFMDNLSVIEKKKLMNSANEIATNNLIEILADSEYDLTYNDVLDIKYEKDDYNSLKNELYNKSENDNNYSSGQYNSMIEYFSSKNDVEESTSSTEIKDPSLRQLLTPGFDKEKFYAKQTKDRTTRMVNGRAVTKTQMDMYEVKRLIRENLGIDIDEDIKNKKVYKKIQKKKRKKSVLNKLSKSSKKKDYKKEAKDITESALLEAVKETTGIEYESVDKYEECTIADYMNSIIKKL